MTNPLLILAAVSVFLPAAACSAPARVVDGDTLSIGDTSYRLNGIDAPEYGQTCGEWKCGEAAAERLNALISGQSVRCDAIGEDGYGRTIATCFVGEADIGAELVRNGFAWAFVKYSKAYVAEEQAARVGKLGIWSVKSQPAWDYRAERWQAAEQTAPEGCPIKGNISNSGRIYHAPWSPWYDRTRINEEEGERWFCDEAEAVAAGWRAPRWR